MYIIVFYFLFFFFKQKTAYELRSSDGSSDVCSSDRIVELPAQPRERAGKGPARATRRTGRVPGVIYGAKKDPNLISVEERLLTKLLHQGGFFSILFDVKVDGKAERVLARDVQFDPVSDKPVHRSEEHTYTHK